jgi:KDO2-lipid IV(A) lauroyltransferase
LGCFEIAAQAYSERFGQTHPMTALYRPARQAWLAALEGRVRARPGLFTAPTNLAGVRQMLKALQRGHCVGLLPDQVPPLRQGVWAPFFGKPAYTMTLSSRLARQTGAVTLLAWGERLSWGRGYVVHVLPFVSALLVPEEQVEPREAKGALAAELDTTELNRALEALVRQHPEQYLWGYARYKAPVAQVEG